jgi:hypothetical protein
MLVLVSPYKPGISIVDPYRWKYVQNSVINKLSVILSDL